MGGARLPHFGQPWPRDSPVVVHGLQARIHIGGNMTTESVQSTFKQFTGLIIGSSVVMIVLGALAMTMPFAAGIGISIFVG
jgi:hypothetical protein